MFKLLEVMEKLDSKIEFFNLIVSFMHFHLI